MLLRELEIFRTVMMAGSANKAAALLGVSQPAVSQSIRRLEDGAGFALFARLRGRLQPTPEARAVPARGYAVPERGWPDGLPVAEPAQPERGEARSGARAAKRRCRP